MKIETLELASPMTDDKLLALAEAVVTRAAEMVNLCFFVELTQERLPGSSNYR